MKIMSVSNTLCGLALAAAAMTANGGELVDPPVFTSSKDSKTLDLLMIAKPAVVDAFPGVTGWAYEICERKYSTGDSCMTGKSNQNPYGGARLQLNAGDTLKVHFVNKLPKIPESKHKEEPGEQFLAQNPTNIHTHGMLVSPSFPSPSEKSPKYGDNIFVLTFNSANGAPDIASSTHLHGDVRTDSTDYQITLPAHHPSGLYWFHPHAHGISLNQVSAGLSGIITVGQIEDYVHGLPENIATRHLILKDAQVNGDNTLNDQEDPELCDLPTTTEGECDRNGGGKWYFTINGQLNPTISVKSAGEIWRITNASGSVTYDLQLTKKIKGKTSSTAGMVMQLLSVDGISATPSRGISRGDLKQIGGAKFEPIPCPGVKSDNPEAVCVSKLHMMPSTRAEIWVVNRDADGKMISADGSQAVLQTTGYSTGPSGDDWPAIDLAQVVFTGNGQGNNSPVLNVLDDKHKVSGLNVDAIAQDLSAANIAVPPDSNCQPLPNGWKRRIFFGIPSNADFGLGFELVDEKGKSVPGSFQDVAAFPDADLSICLPLASGNTPVNERWEVVNLATEDHNFHIHQTKFRVLTTGEMKGRASGLYARGILQDSVPVLAGGDGCDGTIAAWKSGACRTSPVAVEIPFAIAGDFVYHCHILEHEDGGMMAVIHVASSGDSRTTSVRNEHIDISHHH
ncbi:MAG: multicopper oxidase domain-containing protein [Methylobacter sp.]|nr:multicopper oxidase domain-containing protein [Methylobacter sp.]